jgi:hypothetical protein
MGTQRLAAGIIGPRPTAPSSTVVRVSLPAPPPSSKHPLRIGRIEGERGISCLI